MYSKSIDMRTPEVHDDEFERVHQIRPAPIPTDKDVPPIFIHENLAALRDLAKVFNYESS